MACANFAMLEADIKQLSDGGIDYLHVDLMDGRFVSNFGLDFTMMKTFRQLTDIPMDCHLMVEDPERYIDRTAACGAAYIAIHFESTNSVQRALQQIREAGAKSGIVLNPATPITNLEYILDDIDMVTVMTVNPGFAGQKLVPAMLKKIADVRHMLDTTGHSAVEIQADGNVSFEHIPSMVAAGATMLVGGTSSVFQKGLAIGEAITAVRELVKNREQVQ